MNFSKLESKIYLLALFLINFFWFIPLRFQTLMGDDLNAWHFYRSFPTFWSATLFNTTDNKYRPIWDIVQYTFFHVFDHSYLALYLINIFFNGIILYFLFHFLYRLSQNYLVSFSICLLYLLSFFAYYNIQQLNGLMEQMGLFLLLVIVYYAYLLEAERKPSYIWLVLFFYNFVIYVHERYIVLLPFLLLLILFNFNKTKRWILSSILVVIPVFNYILKTVVFHMPFTEGTSGTKIDVQNFQIIRFFFTGLLNILGFNIGPEYLNGIGFSQISTLSKIESGIVAIIFITLLIFSLIELMKMNKEKRLNRIKLWLYALSLIGGLLLVSSITVRVEMRWIYSAYLIMLLLLAYLYKHVQIKKYYKVILITALLLVSIHNDLYFRKNVSKLFFNQAQNVADSTYKVTIQKYGTQFSNYQVFIIKNEELNWPLLGNLFFEQYLTDTSHIQYVDDLKNIQPDKLDSPNTLIYQYKNNQLVQIK